MGLVLSVLVGKGSVYNMFDKMRHSDLKNTFLKKSCGILKIWVLCMWVGVEKSCIWIHFIVIDWIAEV